MQKYLFFFLLLMTSADALATACQPASGSPANLNYDFGNYNITDPAKNVPGTTIPEKTLTAPSSEMDLSCPCTGSGNYSIYLFGDTTLSGGERAGNYTYLDMPGNEYLQVGVNVYTQNQGYISVPFSSGVAASGTHKCGTFSIKTGGSNTGGGIKVSLRIKKPFVGQSMISPVIVASTYWTIGSSADASHGAVATTNILVNGTVTVPQNCVINSGTQVVVDLGQFYSGDFDTAGQKPARYTPKTFNVPIQCNDVSASANLTLRVQGSVSADIPAALQSDNADVGVVIEDSNGTILTPNDSSSLIPFMLDSNNSANITLRTYPVSTTGNIPAEGLFTALAYLRVDFS